MSGSARGGWEEWSAPLWQQPVELFDAMFSSGVRTHYVALARCAPLLIATPGSLVTVSVAIPETEQHQYGAAYAMAKAADDRLALAAAVQLQEHKVASVAVHPGWVRTEGVLLYAEARTLITECLKHLPGSTEFAAFAEEVGAEVPG